VIAESVEVEFFHSTRKEFWFLAKYFSIRTLEELSKFQGCNVSHHLLYNHGFLQSHFTEGEKLFPS
jgi:hypothetical protein